MDQRQEIETPYLLEARVDQVWQNLNLLAAEFRNNGLHEEANELGRQAGKIAAFASNALVKMKYEPQQLVDLSHPTLKPITMDSDTAGSSAGFTNDGSSAVTVASRIPECASHNQEDHLKNNLVAIPKVESTWARAVSSGMGSQDLRAALKEKPSIFPDREGAGLQCSRYASSRENSFEVNDMPSSATPARQVANAASTELVEGTAIPSSATSARRLPNAAPIELVEGNSMTRFGMARRDDNSGLGNDSEEEKAGIVIISGPIHTRENILCFISARINEGPIYDMSIKDDEEIVVIFQKAESAKIFVDGNTELKASHGVSVFGRGDWIVTLGESMEWTDTLRRMSHPHRERRRLTFVKSGLFADRASFMKWVREVQDVAGPGKVDFVWAFNTGNATAVFFNVATARRVMTAFANWRINRGCYEGLTVSYSSDPCEKNLQLTTQLRYHVAPDYRHFRQLAPHGGSNGRYRHYPGRS